jgi:hypothetical protein
MKLEDFKKERWVKAFGETWHCWVHDTFFNWDKGEPCWQCHDEVDRLEDDLKDA